MRGWGRLGSVSEKQREHSGDHFHGQDQGDGEDEAVVTQGGSKEGEERGDWRGLSEAAAIAANEGTWNKCDCPGRRLLWLTRNVRSLTWRVGADSDWEVTGQPSSPQLCSRKRHPAERGGSPMRALPSLPLPPAQWLLYCGFLPRHLGHNGRLWAKCFTYMNQVAQESLKLTPWVAKRKPRCQVGNFPRGHRGETWGAGPVITTASALLQPYSSPHGPPGPSPGLAAATARVPP